jgi:hypothetical protein
MAKWFYSVALGLWLLAACGTDEVPPPKTVALEPLSAHQAVNEVKLAFSEFLEYKYCDQSYPKVCETIGAQAYVLPRSGTDDFRVVFFNNQDHRAGSWAVWDYATISMYGADATTVGRFERRDGLSGEETNGDSMWGVPL